MRRIVALLPLLLASIHVVAFASPIENGAKVELADDEGLILLQIQSVRPFDEIHLRRDKSLFGGIRIRDVPSGQSTWLLRAREGSWRPSRFKVKRVITWQISRPDDEHERQRSSVEVRAGEIAYGGVLDVYFPGDLFHNFLTFRLAFDSTAAYDWMASHHAQTLARYPLVNARDRHDRFFHMYAEILGQAEPTGADVP